jgi:hypothetical protein
MNKRYVVLNKCWYQGELYKPGQVVVLEGKDIPRHFEPYKQGADSELDELREQCFAEGHVFEPQWGVDRLKELLGIAPPVEQVWRRGGTKVKSVEDAVE